MDTMKKVAADEAVVTETKAKSAKSAEKKTESVYTVSQLVDGYKAFEKPKVIVIAALKMDGKKIYTFNDAKKIVNKFAEKEVK